MGSSIDYFTNHHNAGKAAKVIAFPLMKISIWNYCFSFCNDIMNYWVGLMLALLLVHMKENKSEILQNMSTSEVALPAEASWVLFLRQFLPHIAQLLRQLVSGFQTKIQRICNRQFFPWKYSRRSSRRTKLRVVVR